MACVHVNFSRLTSVVSRLALLLAGLGLFAGTATLAQSASTWNKRGQAAEVREDYDTAYEAYRQAHLKKPDDLRYRGRYERMQFQAAVSHVDRGRVLKQSGDTQGALEEFVRAHAIDPGNQTAEQEIRILESAQPGLSPSGPPPGGGATSAAPVSEVPPSNASDVLAELNTVSGPIHLQPASNETVTLHAVEDVKNIYQAIGKEAGLNVLFDPNYTSKRIPVDLTQVSLSDALRIVGTIAGTFYKAVTPNTIFVAQNTRSNRTDLDDQAVQTFYLTNAAQQNDANEIVTGIRNLLDPTVKVYLVPSQNAIVMRATPDQLLLAQKLLNDLDRAKPEVVVDVAVLEVNRDRVRNLGITLPQSIGLTPQTSNASTTTNSSSTNSATTSGTSTNLSLNDLANLNATNIAVTIGGGTVNALLTDSDTRILQNPRIRATDGQRASLKIGQKIPIATGSYNAGVSTGIASIGVQTQFTYLDVGVNIDMTPTVHYDRQVTLKMKIEVSSQNGNTTISGVTEPIIAQRTTEQVIQLKEGEPSILAGIFTKQDTLSVSGTPGLSELPLIKYVFGSRSKENAQDEIVFLLIPHIVRESVLTRLNTRAIDTGTGQGIELRRTATNSDFNVPVAAVPRPTDRPTTAANAASAILGQLRQQAQPPTPDAVPTGTPSSPASPPPAAQTAPTTEQNPALGPAKAWSEQKQTPPAGPPVLLSVVPPSSNQLLGSTFQVSVMATQARDLYAVPLQLQFNPAVLQLVNVDSGDLLGRDGQAVATVHRDEGNGLVTVSSSRPPSVNGVAGQGSVCVLTFKAVAAGDSTIALPKVGARNSLQAPLPVVGSSAVVHVK